jgi:hypothetical protein
MTYRFRAALLLPMTCLLAVCSFVQAAPTHRPAGTPPQWTVSAVALGHGSVAPASQVVDQATTATITVTADPGYVLAALDGGACGAFDNGDGTWTTDLIYADCEVTASFVLSAADVVMQGDFDPDIVSVDNLDLSIDYAILGSSVDWLTGATCHSCPDQLYNLRVASSFPVQAHTYLVFRYPLANAMPADSEGIVADSTGEDPNSIPLMSGASVGPASTFGFPLSIAASSSWRSLSGVDAYVGFRFFNTNTGRINYGYAHLITGASSTTPPSGFPATIPGYAYNRRGDAIVIP